MNLLPLTAYVVLLGRIFTRTVVWTVLVTVVFASPQFAMAKAPPHHQAAHRGGTHHRGGYHRGGYHRVNIYNVGYFRGYHRTGYYRHRGYGYNRQQAWMARMYQQQYQMMMKRQQAEAKAFMAAFDTNHNGIIDGKERGPAEKYLRERRLGKIPPLTATAKAQPRVKK